MKGGMGNIMKQAQQMQQKMLKMQEEMAGRTVEASVGGGMVTVVANGRSEVIGIKIEPQAVDPDDIEMLEDLVLAGVNEALRKAQEMMANEMTKLTGGMKIPGLFYLQLQDGCGMFRPRALNRLIDELSRLPGIGEKTAQRLAFFILRSPQGRAERLAQAIVEVKEKILFCSQCSGITETDPCSLCTDPARDRSLICVVEDPSDVFLVERTGAYKGLYHVLMGALSPLDGIGPEQLKIDTLLERVDAGGVREIICATNPNMEGEATVLYLAKLMKPRGIRLTRLAHGLPVGGHLEYADEVTLGRSLEGRHDL